MLTKLPCGAAANLALGLMAAAQAETDLSAALNKITPLNGSLLASADCAAVVHRISDDN
ncbi:hypothetical protein [Roseibium sp.]|uniref:hypothetical protein n=1 Tax=Roseibium sp. TaxID=1936156 RepID=UPI003A97F967